MDDDFKLGTRSDLPGDQLFLLRDFPRGTWRGRPGLAGTGEIWLANHDRFRALTHGILQALERLRDSGETGHDSAPPCSAISPGFWPGWTVITGSRISIISPPFSAPSRVCCAVSRSSTGIII